MILEPRYCRLLWNTPKFKPAFLSMPRLRSITLAPLELKRIVGLARGARAELLAFSA